MIEDSDTLWPHFAPFWMDARAVAPGLLLTGGYALFLKQRWLLASGDINTLVGVREWRDPVPRSTRDLDFIVEVGLIASPDR